jgi:hypothetical protein
LGAKSAHFLEREALTTLRPAFLRHHAGLQVIAILSPADEKINPAGHVEKSLAIVQGLKK